MAEGNPLVADGATDDPVNFTSDTLDPTTLDGKVTEGDGWLKGTGIWQDTADLATSINQGDAVSVAFGGATVALDVIGAVLDPIGTAASLLVGWMIEHIQPLKEALDALAGDPGVIKGRSDTWHNIAGQLQQSAQQYVREGVNGVSGWKGEAGQAYRAHAGKLAEAMGATGNLAEGMSGLVTICGEGCATVRSLIHFLISELVGKLISWAAEEAGSVGLATPVVVTQALAEIGKVSARVAKLVEQLTELISDLLKIASQVVAHLSTIAKILRELPSIAGGSGPAPTVPA